MEIKRRRTVYEILFKRLFDFLFALIAIIILSPVFLIVSILVRIKLGKPILFKQARPGKKGKVFNILKFRSMTNEKDADGNLLPDEVRLTKFGKLLRKTSLDELPQLFNIFKGDMSLIGPRPKLVKDLWFMNDEQKTRHDVRPGLTGLAQVSGRNDLNWIEVMDLDIAYVDKVTFFRDIKIFFKTFFVVLKKKGISHEGQVTTTDFGEYLVEINQITQEEFENIIALNKKNDSV